MPQILVSDNGTQFTSSEFQQFCDDNGIQHITTAPFHPQSNGQAERFVDTFKRAVKKISGGRGSIEEALDIFLLTYRCTPNPQVTNGTSPSKAMFGRRIRMNLDLLRPPTRPPETKIDQSSLKRKFDIHDLVYAKVFSNNKYRWAPGIVCSKVGRVMYTVFIEESRMIRSHANQLRSRTEPDTSGEPKRAQQNLPLDVLLDSWKLPAKVSPEPITSTQPTEASFHFTPNQSSSLLQSTIVGGSALYPESSVMDTSSSMSSSTTSSSAPSQESASMNGGPVTSLPTEPRRSSRVRRQPQWYHPYHLY